MKNEKLYGVIFVKGNDCGIAKITVYDKTDNMYISSNGDKSSSLLYRTLDLYMNITNYTELERKFVYWVSLEFEHEYDILVESTGTKNASSSDYKIQVSGFYNAEPMIDAVIEKVLRIWHSDDADFYDFDITENATVELELTEEFSGNGLTKAFSLSGTKHAYEPIRFSVDAGVTWVWPWDSSLSWGSNSPNFNDQMVDVNGYYSVKFLTAPDIGVNNVLLNFRPKFNRYKIIETTKQPRSQDGSFIDYKTRVKQQDFGLEMIP